MLKHFINYSKASQANKTLLIYDKHESHVSIAAINLAKENGVTILTLPPHCSHRLQPLDKAVFGPLKRYYNEACSNRLINHPGRRITIHEIADLVGQAYPFAFSTNNVLSGFSKVGTYPYNPNVFTEDDFAAASVTDLQKPMQGSLSNPDQQVDLELTKESEPRPTRSTVNTTLGLPNLNLRVTPEMARPFPKAGGNTKKQ